MDPPATQNYIAANASIEIMRTKLNNLNLGPGPGDPGHASAEAESVQASCRETQLDTLVPCEGIPTNNTATWSAVVEVLNAVQTSIDHMQTTIQSSIHLFQRPVIKERRHLSAPSILADLLQQSWNGSREEGNIIPYEEVPLADGRLPSAVIPELPKLKSMTTIRSLTIPVLKTYLELYGEDVAGLGENSLVVKLAKAIGVSAAVIRSISDETE